MASTESMTKSVASVHLCVLVHGLWGQPSHLNHIVSALRQAYPDDSLEILLAKRNSGNSTYDGIETGGERVTQEIEDELAEIEKSGRKVTKISMVGYSLGGLIVRYAIGLLYSRKWFEKIQPVNFTTFATPHLGVRTPLVGWHNDLWNRFGGRTLSMSGQQMFLIDTFRDTGRPLLALLADPDSIFMRGLSEFKHKSLYANIINDRAVPFYTAYISATNPFTDLSTININYIPGYEDVILDSKQLAVPKNQQLTLYESLSHNASDLISKVPLYLFFALVVIPIGSTAYLVNSGIQSYRSAQRIRLHESGQAGIGIGEYRLSPLISTVQRSAERALDSVKQQKSEEYLPNGGVESGSAEEQDNSGLASSVASLDSVDETVDKDEKQGEELSNKTGSQEDTSGFPVLSLIPEQFAMIESLNALGIDKYAVHIHKASHSHAAIIVRTARQAFGEGKIVSKHWTERFEL